MDEATLFKFGKRIDYRKSHSKGKKSPRKGRSLGHVIELGVKPCSFANASTMASHSPRVAGFPAMTLVPQQRVLHAAARTVLDLIKFRDHVTPALRELHWLPITERIQYKLARRPYFCR